MRSIRTLAAVTVALMAIVAIAQPSHAQVCQDGVCQLPQISAAPAGALQFSGTLSPPVQPAVACQPSPQLLCRQSVPVCSTPQVIQCAPLVHRHVIVAPECRRVYVPPRTVAAACRSSNRWSVGFHVERHNGPNHFHLLR